MPTVPSFPALQQAQLERLRELDSATVANAIEQFRVRLPNVGFSNHKIRCLFPDFPPMIGYAATARTRTANPPMEGRGYIERTDWSNQILSIPPPRVVVLEDMDDPPGRGALIGEMHANILRALGCAGVVTNGSVRGLPASRSLGLQLFAGGVSVSHAYAHILDFGSAVTVGGIHVEPGALLHGDLHGVQTVPMEIADKIADAAERILRAKGRVAELCRRSQFTMDELRAAVAAVSRKEIPQK